MRKHDTLLANNRPKHEAIQCVQQAIKQDFNRVPQTSIVRSQPTHADRQQATAAAKAFRGPLGAAPSTRSGLFSHVPLQSRTPLKFQSADVRRRRSFPVQEPKLTTAKVVRTIKQKAQSLVKLASRKNGTVAQAQRAVQGLGTFTVKKIPHVRPARNAQKIRIQRARQATRSR